MSSQRRGAAQQVADLVEQLGLLASSGPAAAGGCPPAASGVEDVANGVVADFHAARGDSRQPPCYRLGSGTPRSPFLYTLRVSRFSNFIRQIGNTINRFVEEIQRFQLPEDRRAIGAEWSVDCGEIQREQLPEIAEPLWQLP